MFMFQVDIGDPEAIGKQRIKRREGKKWHLRTITGGWQGEFGRHDHDIRELARIMKWSKKLQDFSLNIDYYKGTNSTGFGMLAQSLKRIHSLRKVFFRFKDKFPQKGLLKIGQALKRMPFLKSISFGIFANSCMTDSVLINFYRNFKVLPALQFFESGVGDNYQVTVNPLSALGKSLKRTTSLKHFWLWFYISRDKQDIQFPNFLDFLRRVKSLKSIRMNLPGHTITDNGLSQLSRGLKKQKSLKVVELDLSRCKNISGKGVTSLKKGLKGLTSLQSLKLHFSGCENIAETGAGDFKELNSLKKVYLSFGNCQKFVQYGLTALGQTLKGLTSLQKIRMNFNECLKINDKRLLALMEGLENLSLLQEMKLNFSYCKKFGDEQLSALGKGFKGLISLQKLTLDFRNCERICDEGLFNFGEGLKTLVSLQNIDLDFSQCGKINNRGLSGLGKGLQSLTSLETMKLAFSCFEPGNEGSFLDIADEGFLCFSKSLKNLVSLKEMQLSLLGTHISSKGLLGICDSLKNLTFLQDLCLHLEKSAVSDEGIPVLVESLTGLVSLEFLSLDFGFSQVTHDGRDKIQRKLERIPQLKFDIMVW